MLKQIIKNNIKEIVVGNEADEKLVDIKIIEARDLTNKDQSSSLIQNQSNSDNDLKEYIDQKN